MAARADGAVDWGHYKRMDEWELIEACCLLRSVRPPALDFLHDTEAVAGFMKDAEAVKMSEVAATSISTGVLAAGKSTHCFDELGQWDYWFVKPADVLAWAVSKGYEIPEPLRDMVPEKPHEWIAARSRSNRLARLNQYVEIRRKYLEMTSRQVSAAAMVPQTAIGAKVAKHSTAAPRLTTKRGGTDLRIAKLRDAKQYVQSWRDRYLQQHPRARTGQVLKAFQASDRANGALRAQLGNVSEPKPAQIARWLREGAPDEMKRGGRPRKK